MCYRLGILANGYEENTAIKGNINYYSTRIYHDGFKATKDMRVTFCTMETRGRPEAAFFYEPLVLVTSSIKKPEASFAIKVNDCKLLIVVLHSVDRFSENQFL